MFQENWIELMFKWLCSRGIDYDTVFGQQNKEIYLIVVLFLEVSSIIDFFDKYLKGGKRKNLKVMH